MTYGPVKIDREDGSRMAVVRTNVRGRDMVGFVDAARQKVAVDVPLPQLPADIQVERVDTEPGAVVLAVMWAIFALRILLGI